MQGGIVYSQSFTLPSVLFDSMAFEVRKGRSCDTLQRKQQAEIKALGAELLANGRAIELQTDENKALNVIIQGFKKEAENSKVIHKEELHDEKKKGNKKGVGGFILGVALTVLAAVFL